MKALLSALLLALLLGLMVSTNPTVQDYAGFLRAELVQPTADEEDDLLQALMVVFGGITENLIAASTSRTNYLVLSVYETDIEIYHVECIGAFGHFFGCKSTDE